MGSWSDCKVDNCDNERLAWGSGKQAIFVTALTSLLNTVFFALSRELPFIPEVVADAEESRSSKSWLG